MAFSCPYCGEASPDEAGPACPRCGMDAGGDAPPLLELTDEELAAPGFASIGSEEARAAAAAERERARPIPCPHCDEPVSPKRHRCPKCGRLVKELIDPGVQAAHQDWRRRVRRGVLLLFAGLFVLLLAVSWLGRRGHDRNRSAPRLKRSLRELVEIYGPGARRGPETLTRLFAKSHVGRRVLWTGRCRQLSRGGWFREPEIWLEAEIGDVRAVVLCEMRTASLGDLAEGDTARVDGVLRAYGAAPLFTLEDTILVSVHPR